MEPNIAVSQSLIGNEISKQSPTKLKRMARQSKNIGDWYSAIELYEHYLKKRPKRSHERFELAMLYYRTRNYVQAEKEFRSINEQDTTALPASWFYRGKCLKSMGKYSEAEACFYLFKSHYRSLKDKRTYGKLLKTELEGIALSDSIIANPLPAHITPISDINGAHSEAAPLSIAENQMIYSAITTDVLPIVDINDTNTQFPKMKLYTATLIEGDWQQGTLVKDPVNDFDAHITNPMITHDGKYLIFSVCNENWKGENTCKLYQSRKVNDSWKYPELMKDGINTAGSNSTQPALGRDTERNRYILYFVSDRPGGKGGFDIWYTQFNKLTDQWTTPRNCGSKINSAGDEFTPWFDLAQNTLYFSSDGHPGIGALDVYKTVGERSRWSEPEILGTPINSPTDDIYFRKQLRERYAFVVSNRPGSKTIWNNTCCDDIYEVFYPEKFEGILRINVSQLLDGNDIPIGEALIKLYAFDPATGERFLIKSDTAADGSLLMTFEPGKHYSIEGGKGGFYSNLQTLDLTKSKSGDTVDLVLQLKPWDEKPMQIPNIYFEFNSDELTAESKQAIDTTIHKLLQENLGLIIEIMAHTDSKGDDNYNKKLSQKRAESVRDYLIEKGTEKDRIQAKGYGEEQPIAPNQNADGSDNPEGRAKNRRVEFRITGTKMEIRSSW